MLPGAEPFEAAGGPVGVLLCHGFTGSPQTLRGWAEYLAAEGLTVSLPRLPGHGTTWQDLAQTGDPAGGHPQLAALGDRELTVLACLVSGLERREIALRLGIAENTVRTHVGRILAKNWWAARYPRYFTHCDPPDLVQREIGRRRLLLRRDLRSQRRADEAGQDTGRKKPSS